MSTPHLAAIELDRLQHLAAFAGRAARSYDSLRAASAATRLSFGRVRQPARLGWADVADLDEPADGVGDGLAQWA
jgi:hypothetical protein